MSQKILLVQFANNRILRKIKAIKQAEYPHVISLSNDASVQLNNANIGFADFSEYISPEDFKDVNDSAVETVRKWYKQEEISETCTFENINMGQFSELFLTGYFIEVFKRIIITEKICVHHQPGKIIYSSSTEPFNMGSPEDLWASVIEAFSRKNNIETLALHHNFGSFFFIREKLKYWLDRHYLFPLFSGGISKTMLRIYLQLICNYFKADRNWGEKGIVFAGPANLLTGSVKLMNILKRKGFSVKVLMHENFHARDFFLKNSISAQTFKEIKIDGSHKQKIKKTVKHFKNRTKNKVADIKKLKPLLFRKVNLWPLIYDRLCYEFEYIYPRLIENMKKFSYRTAKEDVRCVVVPTSVAPEARALLVQASKLNIPTVEIQHGVTKWAPSYLPLFADAVFVWGEMTKDWYLEHGVKPSSIFITGRIAGTSQKKTISNIEGLKQKLNLPPNKKIILVATQPAICVDSLTRPKGNTPTIQAIIDELAELKNAMLVIKLHPGESLSDYSNLEIKNSKVLVTKQGDAQDYLNICDILIVGDSTIAIDAMINNKPVVYINLDGSKDLVDYPRYGACPVYQRKDILPSVEALLYNGTINYNQNSINKMVACEGKEAAEKASRAILSMFETKVAG